MGILDGIVEWIAEQVMNILDLITTSVLGALGCSMDTFSPVFSSSGNNVPDFFWHWLSDSSF